MNKKGIRTTGFLALLIAIIIITSNVRGSDNSALFEKISDNYNLVDAIDVEYEDEAREPVTLTSAYLAQVKQAFAPRKLASSKTLNIKGFTKLATLTYRIGDEVLFTAPLYLDDAGENMYEIIAKEKYASSKAILFLK
jgi:hypothetical protein